MPREYQVGLGYFTGKIERMEGDRPPQVTERDTFAIQVAIAERLQAIVEGIDHLVEGGKEVR